MPTRLSGSRWTVICKAPSPIQSRKAPGNRYFAVSRRCFYVFTISESELQVLLGLLGEHVGHVAAEGEVNGVAQVVIALHVDGGHDDDAAAAYMQYLLDTP